MVSPAEKFTAINSFSRRLLKEWRELKLPTSDATIIVAVSGGADSTALLLSLGELVERRKLSLNILVAHLDHGLRKSSKQDSRWVSKLAGQLGVLSISGRVSVTQLATSGEFKNIEEVARKARYEFLERTAKRKRASCVLTAHTMDDQAETVLLRLMRGSSTPGLSAMERVRPIQETSSILLVRPLLWARRQQTEGYCEARNTLYLTDEMNEDESLARVRVRRKLIPLMRTFNNKVVEALARTANLMREDGIVLSEAGNALLQQAILADNSFTNGSASEARPKISVLAEAPPSLRRQAIWLWISGARGDSRRLEMVHILAIEALLKSNGNGRTVELPKGGRVTRNRGRLEFNSKND